MNAKGLQPDDAVVLVVVAPPPVFEQQEVDDMEAQQVDDDGLEFRDVDAAFVEQQQQEDGLFEEPPRVFDEEVGVLPIVVSTTQDNRDDDDDVSFSGGETDGRALHSCKLLLLVDEADDEKKARCATKEVEPSPKTFQEETDAIDNELKEKEDRSVVTPCPALPSTNLAVVDERLGNDDAKAEPQKLSFLKKVRVPLLKVLFFEKELSLVEKEPDQEKERDRAVHPDTGNVVDPLLRISRFEDQPGMFHVSSTLSTREAGDGGGRSADGNESPPPLPPEENPEVVDQNTPRIPSASLVVVGDGPDNVRVVDNAEDTDLVHAVPIPDVVLCSLARMRQCSMAVVALLLLMAVLILLLALGFPRDKRDGWGPQQPVEHPIAQSVRPLLEVIREDDVLRCGVWASLREFPIVPEDVMLMDVLVCRALAAALLGDPNKTDIVVTNDSENLECLTNGTIHVLTGHAHTTMQTDVYQPELQTGFSFSLEFLYTDYVYLGRDPYVACAEDMNTLGDCEGMRICTNSAHSFFSDVVEHIPKKYLIIKETDHEVFQGFMNHTCNVIMDAGVFRSILNSFGIDDFVVGTKHVEASGATVAIKDGDPHFIDIINVVLLALMAAEQQGITQSRASDIGETHLLGDHYKDGLIHAISATGNYKEFYNNGAEPILPRNVSIWNWLNNGTTGLMRATYFGPTLLDRPGPGPVAGGTLETILNRTTLRCGVRPNRPGFVKFINDTMQGLDVDFCRAVAASTFTGDDQALELVLVVNASDAYRKLASDEVDLLAGFEWTIQSDVREPTTGKGYSFSQPYFYSPLNNSAGWEENICLVTRQDDDQFTSFVNWIVAATIYAEKHGISQSNEMPLVNLFGPNFTKMFRDTIYVVGNYREMYERNLEELLPRSGRNMLNSGDNMGPQLYPPPGFFT